MVTRFKPSRVTPFGNLWINACLAATQSLSQPTTSFIGLLRQGIHRMPLICFIEIAILFSFKCATPSTVETVTLNTWTYPNNCLRTTLCLFENQSITFFFRYLDMDLRRIELLTSSLQMRRSGHLNYRPRFQTGGRAKTRTWDLSLIRTAL